VIRVRVSGAPSAASARAIGKSIVNSPLFKCAVAGNDPNVGRLVASIGKTLGVLPDGARVDTKAVALTMGGRRIFANGVFALDGETEKALVAHLRGAQLWESTPRVAASAVPQTLAEGYALRAADVSFTTPIQFPPHERCVEIGVDLGLANGASATVIGADLTHEYVAENADYRS
jgi:glutamate N-acetyltransferase/amino-acid N-acetyltransferase